MYNVVYSVLAKPAIAGAGLMKWQVKRSSSKPGIRQAAVRSVSP